MRSLLFCSFVLAACGADAAPVPPSSDAPAKDAPATGTPPAPASDETKPQDPTPAPATVSDPTKDGPFTVAELDDSAQVDATGDDVPVHVAYPKSGAGPFPVVVLAHGFQIDSSLYYGYIRRLASFGYVALTADYPAGFTSTSNVRDAENLSGALDWALAAKDLAGKIDDKKIGVMGHSRGGKAAVLAAAKDARFRAVLGLDPVDVKPPFGCDAKTECPDARDALSALALPTAFVGETTDATSSGAFSQACAPADGNYGTFYAKAKSPSVSLTVAGANHVSFVDDVDACGTTCSFCQAATAKHDDVIALARAITVAFFERHLRGIAAYQTYLDGAMAQMLWVGPGVATIQSK